MSKFQRGASSSSNHPPVAPEEGEKKSPPVSHGAGTLLRLYRSRALDLRRSDHRMIYEWQQALVEDLGGQAAVDTFQRSMIDRATELLIMISAMATHVEQNGVMKGDELAPCLRYNFLAYVNSFRHTLTAAFEHGKKQGPKKPINLKDYLEANNGKEEGEDGEKKDGASESRRHHFGTDDGDQGGS